MGVLDKISMAHWFWACRLMSIQGVRALQAMPQRGAMKNEAHGCMQGPPGAYHHQNGMSWTVLYDAACEMCPQSCSGALSA